MYRIDLHPSTGGDNYIDVGSCPFEIPLGALLPQRVTNLLPAGKNIGTTHITNGCYRLHPVEWNVGEVAGAARRLLPGPRRHPARGAATTPALLADFQYRLDRRRRRAPLARRPRLLRRNPTHEDQDMSIAPTVCLAALAACGVRLGGYGRQGRSTLRMTIWSANEAHLKLFNEIAADYKASPPRRHRHLRRAAVRELHHHADHPDRRRQRPRPRLDPREPRRPTSSPPAPWRRSTATLEKRRRARPRRRADRAVEAGRQALSPTRSPPRRSGSSSTTTCSSRPARNPGRADRRRRVDLGRTRSRSAAAVAARPASRAWSSATSTTRTGTTWPPIWTAGAPRPGAPTARPAASTSSRWSTR